MDILTLVEFVLFFGVMLFIHEFGHYITAKLLGIRVDEFGFGFPPRLVKIGQFKETEITLNWIPFGAFVRLSGENDPEVPGGFGSAAPWKRIAVLLGGPLMNLAAGVILFMVLFGRLGMSDTSKVLVSVVEPGSPAESAGLQVGDLITAINGSAIDNTQALIDEVKLHLGQEITLGIQRGDQQIEASATPRENPPEGQGALGIAMTNPVIPIPWYQTVPMAFQATFEQIKLTLEMPAKLIRGEVSGADARVVGPVGMYSMFSYAREEDESAATAASGAPVNTSNLMTMQLMIVISIALGLTNLLPIPALDGGRILFTLPELIFRKRIPPQYENAVNTIGFLALLVLMFFVTAQDIINPINLH